MVYLYHKEAFLHKLIRTELHPQQTKDIKDKQEEMPNDVKDWMQSSLPKFPTDSKTEVQIRVVLGYIKLAGNRMYTEKNNRLGEANHNRGPYNGKVREKSSNWNTIVQYKYKRTGLHRKESTLN